MSQISSPSSIASSPSSPSIASTPKKAIGVPSNNVYTVMLIVAALLLGTGITVVFMQYRAMYPGADIFLSDLPKK